MGYIRHHAIVVTSWKSDVIHAARREAKDVGLEVTEIVDSPVNGYMSFLVCPDGSKEGWSESDAGDAGRERFVAYLRSTVHEDGSGPIAWAELFYGDDYDQVGIVHDSSELRRSTAGQTVS